MALDLRVVPEGSSTLTRPLELSLGGPFTSAGGGTLPQSDLTIALSAQGHRFSLRVISAGGRGYITVGGQSYRMPASSFRSLESGFGSLAGSSASSATGTGTLGKLGIHPLDWLSDPRVVGTPTIDGVRTTQVRAGVDTRALLHDLSRLLGRAGTLAGAGAARTLPQTIPAAEQRRIARALGAPSLNVWTGSGDSVIRRLAFAATIPVTGRTRTLLGGMTAARVTFEFGYSHLNQRQAIAAPTSVKPYSVFRAQVDTVLREIEGGLVTGTAGGSGSGTGSSGAAGADQRYTRCIAAAAGDVAKMQRCSKVLTAG